ncbi:MAG: heavy metal-binding domain-containing protein [Deltaproteobacteria bacterium]|nr:heavy metal-binding domain-containing protein [Deltaproteobacteria bacterium]
MIPQGRHPPLDLNASLARVAQGGIPLRAQERLAEEAGPNRRLFTSDLSVSEFLLARDAHCEPISQVMGSSIFHVGQIADYKGSTGEIAVISDAHRQVRHRALSRLFQEAIYVGADAVIGARLKERMITMGQRGKGGDDGGEVLEFTVVGTAVRAPWITHAPGHPIVTDLSGQDLWALAQDGYEPCGFLFEFCQYHVWHVTSEFVGVGELGKAYNGIETARNIVGRKVFEQARYFQAEFVVGSDISLEVKEVPCGFNNCELNDMDVKVSWFGTGIRRIPGAAQRVQADVPPLILSMMPIGRHQDVKLEVEDDADDIERAAEEAEEIALEIDEGIT